MKYGNSLCNHNWVILVDRLIKGKADSKECEEEPPKTCVSITILKCTKCGELDKTVILDKNHRWGDANEDTLERWP